MTLVTSDLLQVSVEDRVATLTLNQPDKLNAINDEMTAAAISQLEAFANDPDVGAIVLTGAGRAFCAGGDVSTMGGRGSGSGGPPTLEANMDVQLWRQPTLEANMDVQLWRHQLPWLLHRIPKVTIAAVNGHAVGAGLGIALSCDLRFISSASKFGTAFANVGFGGDYGTTWQLTRLVGEGKAKELFFLPDVIDSEEAMRIGIGNRLFDKENFMEEVTKVATRIAHGPLVSYRYMKENVNLSMENDFRTVLDREATTHLRCGMTEDHREGVAAFMEKRKPQFKGR